MEGTGDKWRQFRYKDEFFHILVNQMPNKREKPLFEESYGAREIRTAYE